MNQKAAILVAAFTLFSRIALAARGGDEDSPDLLINAIVGFLPLLLFLGTIYYFLRRYLRSRLVTLQQDYLSRQIQHTQRVEDLLERIAKALEKDKRV